MLNKGGVKINGGSEAFVKFNKRGAGGLVGFKIDGVFGISRNSLISVMNENRDINV